MGSRISLRNFHDAGKVKVITGCSDKLSRGPSKDRGTPGMLTIFLFVKSTNEELDGGTVFLTLK